MTGPRPLTADRASSRAYSQARAEGKDRAEAQQIAKDARRRFKAEARLAGHEWERLRRDRDALLSALAEALGVTESEALRIARLNIEEDD